MTTILRNTAVAVMALCVSFPAADTHALGLSDVTGAIGGNTGNDSGDSSDATVDVDALTDKGKGLREKFDAALNNMLLAQAKTATALDLKDEADKAEDAAKPYADGDVTDTDQIKRTLKESQEISKTIADKIAQGATLDASGKKHLAAAVPHYVKSLTGIAKLPKEFKNYTQAVQKGMAGLRTHPTDALKLKDATADILYIATQLPDFISLFTDTSKNFAAFAKSNDVSTANLNAEIKITAEDL